jgi:hypothetical protein
MEVEISLLTSTSMIPDIALHLGFGFGLWKPLARDAERMARDVCSGWFRYM